jgi:hypothetical protein
MEPVPSRMVALMIFAGEKVGGVAERMSSE